MLIIKYNNLVNSQFPTRVSFQKYVNVTQYNEDEFVTYFNDSSLSEGILELQKVHKKTSSIAQNFSNRVLLNRKNNHFSNSVQLLYKVFSFVNFIKFEDFEPHQSFYILFFYLNKRINLYIKSLHLQIKRLKEIKKKKQTKFSFSFPYVKGKSLFQRYNRYSKEKRKYILTTKPFKTLRLYRKKKLASNFSKLLQKISLLRVKLTLRTVREKKFLTKIKVLRRQIEKTLKKTKKCTKNKLLNLFFTNVISNSVRCFLFTFKKFKCNRQLFPFKRTLVFLRKSFRFFKNKKRKFYKKNFKFIYGLTSSYSLYDSQTTFSEISLQDVNAFLPKTTSFSKELLRSSNIFSSSRFSTYNSIGEYTYSDSFIRLNEQPFIKLPTIQSTINTAKSLAYFSNNLEINSLILYFKKFNSLKKKGIHNRKKRFLRFYKRERASYFSRRSSFFISSILSETKGKSKVFGDKKKKKNLTFQTAQKNVQSKSSVVKSNDVSKTLLDTKQLNPFIEIKRANSLNLERIIFKDINKKLSLLKNNDLKKGGKDFSTLN